jgi:hypothetical protein
MCPEGPYASFAALNHSGHTTVHTGLCANRPLTPGFAAWNVVVLIG